MYGALDCEKVNLQLDDIDTEYIDNSYVNNIINLNTINLSYALRRALDFYSLLLKKLFPRSDITTLLQKYIDVIKRQPRSILEARKLVAAAIIAFSEHHDRFYNMPTLVKTSQSSKRNLKRRSRVIRQVCFTSKSESICSTPFTLSTIDLSGHLYSQSNTTIDFLINMYYYKEDGVMNSYKTALTEVNDEANDTVVISQSEESIIHNLFDVNQSNTEFVDNLATSHCNTPENVLKPSLSLLETTWKRSVLIFIKFLKFSGLLYKLEEGNPSELTIVALIYVAYLSDNINRFDIKLKHLAEAFNYPVSSISRKKSYIISLISDFLIANNIISIDCSIVILKMKVQLWLDINCRTN